jgi:NIPSNAP
MMAQVRTYTANKGRLDEWVKLFNEQIAPIHEKYGVKVLAAFVNRPQNEFIWVRLFRDQQHLEEGIRAYLTSPERVALGDIPNQLLAKRDSRDVEDVFAPGALPV